MNYIKEVYQKYHIKDPLKDVDKGREEQEMKNTKFYESRLRNP